MNYQHRLLVATLILLLTVAACGQAGTADLASVNLGQSSAGTSETLPASVAKAAGSVSKLAESSQAPNAQISDEVIPCPMNLPKGEVDGETIVCGQITVPENWDDPGERTIDITYAIQKAKSLSPFPEPIIYLEGGPGGTALEDIESLSEYFVKLRATRDIIYYDQRGTDYSGNLDCPLSVKYGEPVDEFGRTPEDVEEAEEEATDSAATPEAEPDTPSLTQQPLYEQDPQVILELISSIDVPSETNCVGYFEEQGVDLTQYNTAASIRDLTALMNALDYDIYNVYGISYGSRLGLELLRVYEEEDTDIPEIRSVVIDGIDPPQVDNVTQTPFISMYIVLDTLAACEADDACGAAYPNIRQRTIDLLAQAEETPLEIIASNGMTDTVAGPSLALLLGGNAATSDGELTPISSPMVIPYLPRLADELSRGVGDVYLGLMSGALPPAVAPDQILQRNQFDPLAARTLQMAAEAGQLSEELQALAAQMQRASEAQAENGSLPELFVRELITIESENPSFAEQKPRFEAILQILAKAEPTRENLEGSLDAFSLDANDMASLMALIGMMSEEEAAQAFKLLLSDRVQEQLIAAIQRQMNTAVSCNDLSPDFDINAAFEAYKNAEAPQLLTNIQAFLSYLARCERYGLTEGEGESSEPVVSSLPILVVNGSVDKNTAARWGESTVEFLPNAQMVTIPLVAHGASALSPCGQDITNAFFTYPEEEVNDYCTAVLQPVYVLPEDDLGLTAGDGS